MHEIHHLSDADFLQRFLTADLPAEGFDHRGHLRAAWLVLQRQPLPEAIETVCQGIERLATALGVPGKYHRTLSEALVRWMAAMGAARHDVSFETFLADHPDLVADARGVLARHYSAAVLAQAQARQQWVPPDRQALPLPAL